MSTNIIDKWKKSMDMNEQTEKSIRELKTVNMQSRDLLDQNIELLNETKMELKYTQLKILQRLEEQQAVIRRMELLEPKQDNQDEVLRRLDNQDRILHRLDNQELTGAGAATEDTDVEALQELQEALQNDVGLLMKGMEDLTGNITGLQQQILEEHEAERKREFRIIRSYFKAVLWILLILVVLFGAYIWGFIGTNAIFG